MPQLQNRQNAMMPVKEEKPSVKINDKPNISEKEDEMFNKEPKIKLDENRRIIDNETQNVDMSITAPVQELQSEEFVEPVVEPVKKKKEKKPCSDKLKAHLQRCREKSLASRRAKKSEKSKPVDIPKNPTPQPVVNNNNIDYDKIISGVSNTLYSRFGFDEPQYKPTQNLQINQPQNTIQKQTVNTNHLDYQQQRLNQPTVNKKMLLEYEKKIRQDERERIKKEREAELSQSYKSKGMQVLKNGIPTHRKKDIQIPNNGTQINPFANAFGRRF
tara:strand:- start:355 stop:1173 length:819 start_codon:yes stop_codon:yes gene_type:complete